DAAGATCGGCVRVRGVVERVDADSVPGDSDDRDAPGGGLAAAAVFAVAVGGRRFVHQRRGGVGGCDCGRHRRWKTGSRPPVIQDRPALGGPITARAKDDPRRTDLVIRRRHRYLYSEIPTEDRWLGREPTGVFAMKWFSTVVFVSALVFCVGWAAT